MTARIATALYGEMRIKRLVVIDGSLCGLDCPHRVPNNGCNAFWAPGMEVSYHGRSWRCQECASTALRVSEPRAERALERLRELRKRKVIVPRKRKQEQVAETMVAVPVDMEKRTETRCLKCRLTDAEIVAKLNESSDLSQMIAALKARLKLAKKAASDGFEFRDVECTAELYSKAKSAVIVRNDTGEVVEQRDMTADELQVRISGT